MAWSRNPYYSTPEWHALSRATLKRDRNVCYLCGAHATMADHVINRRSGGADHLSNLRAICRPCHDRKSATEGSRAALAKRGGLTRRPTEKHPGLM